MRLKLHGIVLLLVLGLILAACSDDGGDDGGGGGGGEASTEAAEVTIALGQEPSTLDPQLVDSGFERAVNDNIYETLLTRTPEGELSADGLAEAMPEQIDNKTWQFTLRDGITWHNGDPLTADDVVASVERIINPDFASEQGSFFGTIIGAEAVDELTVNVLTNGPDPVLPSRMYWMKIVPAAASEEEGFDENPVGTGPYMFVEWARGDHITIEKYPDYWGDNPSNVETANYNFVPEAATRLSGLLSDQYNIAPNLLPEDTESAPKFATTRGLEHAMVVLNETGGLTEDVRVRQALNYAIDKDAIVEELFQGYATVDPCQPMDPAWFGFNPDLEPYPYDPDQATQLLEEAGATGEEIELVGTAGRWLKDREVIEAVANFWRDVGLNVNVRIFELGEYNNRLFHGGENIPDTIFVSSSNEIFDADRNLSAYLQPNFLGGANDDPQMEEWLNTARTETDVAAREDIYHQVLQKSCDEAYLANLYNNEDIYGMTQDMDWEPRVDAKMLVKEMQVTG
jgi:peptide/nickel transport system substrate-binding protein